MNRGSTLALAYSETHPEPCTALVLRGIFFGRKWELEWFTGPTGIASEFLSFSLGLVLTGQASFRTNSLSLNAIRMSFKTDPPVIACSPLSLPTSATMWKHIITP